MTELLTAAQMKAIEAAAIASGEVTGLELMERAGRGVVEAIFEEWPELRATSHRAVVLCGPGGNGGDGFVVARLLKEWGWEVEVFLYSDPEKMPPDARVNYERWRGMGEVGATEPDALWPSLFKEDLDIVIDALFGTGLTRPAPSLEPFEMLVHRVFVDGLWWTGERPRPWIVAIDNPSDMCCDSGVVLESGEGRYEAYAAHLTVTFHRPKLGHFLGEGPKYCSKLRVADIGLRASEAEGLVSRHPTRKGTFLTRSPKQDYEIWQSLRRAEGGHKYSHGHALILSGPSGRGGAARLAARGALRIGAGVVTVGCPLDAIPEHAARLDAVTLRAVADGATLAEVLGDKRINALCLGPGLGTGAPEAGLVAAALGLDTGGPPSAPHEGEGGRKGQPSGATGDAEALPLPLVERGEGRGAPALDRRNVVLDADALTILSHHPDLFAALHDGCILTPHAGEFARLFPDIAEKLAAPATKGPAYSKVDATREAAARAGCVVLYKGPDTVIADPTGRCAINSAHYDRAAPWLATAGSGDVLAGFITGLLARGFSPFDAACTGAWLHVECARSFGPGLIAEDLPEELPKVFRALGV
ncbi:NAD(P)H-hydrate epimerase [Tabrizicola sp.]|uniref:NAD(P)H-hydrate epimerase n=1 Tax=Tabrizicola sp. TaxID=2005166 RepID=UPI00286D1410|nr:NAD(P)H-hydrate epimerase [Tabrizicola sp.]